VAAIIITTTTELLGVDQHLGGGSHTRKADLLLMMHNHHGGIVVIILLAMVVGFAMAIYCLPRRIAVVATTVVTNITASPTLLPHEEALVAHEENNTILA